MKKNLSILLLFVVMATISCKKDDYNAGTTKVPNAANGWWVTYSYEGSPLTGHVFLSTYNTSANTTDSLWVDDDGNFSGFKGKVALNYSALTFSNPVMVNVNGSDSLIVANGKILPKAGHSTSGLATDSLYMEIQISDDTDGPNPAPYGFTYVISGTARTGLLEDDY